jgi:hypothetical protein
MSVAVGVGGPAFVDELPDPLKLAGAETPDRAIAIDDRDELG